MATLEPGKAKKSSESANPSPSSSIAESSSSKKQQVYNTVNAGLDVMANVAEGSDILAPLKAACKTTQSILGVMQGIETNKEGWTDLRGRLEQFNNEMEKQITLIEAHPVADRAIRKTVQQPLTDYLEFLKGIQLRIADLQGTKRKKLGLFKAFSKVKIDAGEIRKFNLDIEDRHRQLMNALAVLTTLRIQALEETSKANMEKAKADADAAVILQLPTVDFVASSVHRACLKGTREAVLQMIWDWANNEQSDKPIFWLCDIAGSGKSTVAMSASERWQEEGTLGGRFFFSMASSEGSTVDKFCSTIARDLVHYTPQLAPHIAEAVKRNPSFMRSSLGEQFRTLITDPVRRQQRYVILVIDAVDECKCGSQRKKLLETLHTAVEECKSLKIFITSRPDPVVQSILGPLLIKARVEDRLHNVYYPDNVDDIATYIHWSLGGVLSPDKRQQLVAKAKGLFIWASTACQMLNGSTPWDTPENIYNELMSVDKAGEVDDVYSLIFERVDPKAQESMWKLLSLLIAAFEPLTVKELQNIFVHTKLRGDVNSLTQHLGSVLSVNQSTKLIQFRHPTLVEYLRRRSTTPSANNTTINPVDAHGQAASWCLNRLLSRTEGLKFNICQIESSFYLNRQIPNLEKRISEFIPRQLQYASSHWLFHVANTDDGWRSMLRKELKQITQITYALHWMEVLSFVRGVPRAMTGLRAIARCTRLEEETKNRISEMRRFIMAFSVPIQESAPHIYISGLPFTPKESRMHSEGVIKYKGGLTVTNGLEAMYSGFPTALRGHTLLVTAVGFSPDGTRIVSGSLDKTIRLWEAETGQPLGEPLRGHEGSVMAVGFSPDGTRIVSGSNDKTIRLWEAETGQPLGEPLRGHQEPVRAVAFSPNGARIVSGSDDNTIRLWEAETGEPRGEPLRGHQGSVTAVGFSPDGTRIVSSSQDSTIRLWYAETGQPLGEPLRGHEGWVMAVGFSPDGTRIVSGSDDSTIRLWEAETGQLLGEPLRGHEGWVMAVGFSPDGTQIVSGSNDKMIRLWEAETGQPLGEPLQGHEYPVRAVGFSPDGTRIVSGSLDKTIRLWEAETGQPLGEPLRGHQDLVKAVGFSPDGTRIVSGSSDKTIRLWEAETGQPLGEPLQGHQGSVRAVGFSPDGTRIISGSNDETIRLWEAETGQPLGEPLRGHKDWVTAIGISPDGTRIVSGSSNSKIRLWEAETGQPLGEPLQGHQGSVTAVGFSPDGTKIISSSSDETIRLWEAETGQPLGEPLRGHQGWVTAVGFSPDGTRIVSGSDDSTIRLWEAETGQPLGEPLRGHQESVRAVAFSPDGTRIVSGSDDSTIRLWEAETGQLLGEPLQGHQEPVRAVAFSPDGTRIVSGSDDRTIRLWDTEIVATVNHSNMNDGEPLDSTPGEVLQGTPLRITIPGFNQCLLSQDGWVHSSNQLLFWVPPDNRHGLVYPHILAIPTTSPYRATRIDFTHFQCGTAWTNVRTDANS